MSLNIQGFRQNYAYISQIYKQYDLILLQEHWLPSFDTALISSELKDIVALHSTATDALDDQFQFCKRPICYGGVATLWGNKLSPYIDPSNQEGNSRILLTKINLPHNPLCVINCYLPSGNSKAARDTFMEDLDMLHELLETYSSTHDVIIMGDLNVDHFHRKGPKELAFLQLVKEHDMRDLGITTKNDVTYENIFLKHSSHIDHALLKKRHHNSTWQDYNIRSEDSQTHLNTSYHHPITLTVRLLKARESSQKHVHMNPKRVYNLKKIDSQIFQDVLEDELADIHVDMLDAEAATHILQKAIDTATHSSAPCRVLRNSHKGTKTCKWTTQLAEAVHTSKRTHFEWKSAGCPRGLDPLWHAKKEAKKLVRRVQRQQVALERIALYDEINKASEKDSGLFHRLVRRQRKRDNPKYTLLVDGILVEDTDEQREVMANHFRDLARPQITCKDSADFNRYLRLLYNIQPAIFQVTARALDTAISELAKGKAKDIYNQAAEQIHLLTPKAREILLFILQEIGRKKVIPEGMKLAYKIPIPKSGKDNRLLDNHRGITIAPILLKTLEVVAANEELRDKIDISTNNLQVGFTRNHSPSMASLLITEAVAQAHQLGSPLYIATLDARKAFDVVNYDTLKKKLYQIDISGGLWGIVDNMYTDSLECVRWKGGDSATFITGQGVKQGSIISPMLYKAYINDLLDSLQGNQLGAFIGDLFVGSPTCADDVLLISHNQHQLQAMLNVCHDYAACHLYEIHPKKSSVTVLHQPRRLKGAAHKWYLGNTPVTQSDSFTHLGIEWSKGQSHPNVQSNISKARRAAYALMRTGLHGCDGLGPATSIRLIQLFVTPCLLHGLDAAVLDKSSIHQLETFYRKILRQVQSLPESTAVEAIYWMSGNTPIEGQYHSRMLLLFGGICRLPPDHTLRRLALRQLSMPNNRRSWFSTVARLGVQYELNILQQLAFPWPKAVWKRMVKNSIRTFWHINMVTSSREKSSLNWLIVDDEPTSSPHQIWTDCHASSTLRESANIRAKMLTGKFKTATVMARYHPEKASSICKLCQREDEDILHFLVTCSENKIDFRRIQDHYTEEGRQPPTTDRELCSAILNGNRYQTEESSPRIIGLSDPSRSRRANQGSSLLCSKIVKDRETIILM